jgi:uncharacterized protein
VDLGFVFKWPLIGENKYTNSLPRNVKSGINLVNMAFKMIFSSNLYFYRLTMTEYAVIALTALFGSGLTLFSGFGLGTLLVPVFALFFPIEVAIALTAIVHFLNNLFKLLLLGKSADKPTVLRFGIPSLLASFAGAWLLTLISGSDPLFSYELQGNIFYVTPVKLTIALLLVFFVLFDTLPALARIHFDRKYLVAGGLLSGFFGGLSGNQGALRSAFLIKAGLTKESFIATGVVIACMVDIARLTVYSDRILGGVSRSHAPLLAVACLAAFAGAFIGNSLLKKMTLVSVQRLVAVLLLVFSILLGAGII